MRKFIVFFLSLLLTGFTLAQNQLDTLSLDSILDGAFYPNFVWGYKSMNDGLHYTSIKYTPNGAYLIKYSYKTGKAVDTLVNFAKLGVPFPSPNYKFSKDENLILFYRLVHKIYRRSFTAYYYVYNLKTQKLTPITDHPIRIADLAPDGSKVSFMYKNNLYIFDLKTHKTTQITFDGQKNKIINGAPDWVYEEEFSFNQAYHWSPNSQYIAYMKFDESQVKTYTLKFYPDDYNKPYPEIYTYKYPKAGEKNSIVTVYIYNLKNQKTTKVNFPHHYEYVPRIKWRPDSKYLGIEVMNRRQDTLEFLLANPANGQTKLALTETNKKFIEDGFYDNLRFLPDNHIILLSERDGWRHFYLYDWDGNFEKALNHGNWDVIKYIAYNPKTKTLYYQAAKTSPLNREVYALNIKSGKDIPIANRPGTNDVEFSKSFKYYLLHFSSAQTPDYFAIYNIHNHLIRVIYDNQWLLNKIKKYGGINKTFFTFTTEDSVKLYAYRIVPPNFDSTKQYPAIVMQYSGPNIQTVLNTWEFGWANYLADHGFIVFGVDTRGTGARGEAFRKITYLKLGIYESHDLMEAAKYIGSLPYVKKHRIGLWGWSYGGFMVLLTLTRFPGYYHAGIAVAPVTNWRYYDDIYTERYMLTPQQNPEGYKITSPITYAKNLRDHLLIIHGLADDNVHPENTFQFVNQLIKYNKQFQMFIYPNKNHALPGTYHQLYRMKTNFFIKYLMNQ